MPTYQLKVEVNEWGPKTEKSLSRFGEITEKNEPWGLYFLNARVQGNDSLETAERYVKLLSELEDEPYVNRVKESRNVKALSNNRIALDLGIKLELEKLKILS